MKWGRLALDRDCCVGRRVSWIRIGNCHIERIVLGEDVRHHSGKAEVEKRLDKGVAQETLLVINAILESDGLRVLIVEIGTDCIGSLAKRVIFGDRCVLGGIAPREAEEIGDEEVERPDIDLPDTRDELIEGGSCPDLDTAILPTWCEGASGWSKVPRGIGTG